MLFDNLDNFIDIVHEEMLRFAVDSIHMDSTALGAKEKARDTSFKGFFFMSKEGYSYVHMVIL